jgi:hypothetical protein
MARTSGVRDFLFVYGSGIAETSPPGNDGLDGGARMGPLNEPLGTGALIGAGALTGDDGIIPAGCDPNVGSGAVGGKVASYIEAAGPDARGG